MKRTTRLNDARVKHPRVVLPEILITSTGVAAAQVIARSLRIDARVTVCSPTGPALAALSTTPDAIVVEACRKSLREMEIDFGLVAGRFPKTPFAIHTDLDASSLALLDARHRGAIAVLFVDATNHPAVTYRTLSCAFALHMAMEVADDFADPWLKRLVLSVISGACSDLTVPRLAWDLSMSYPKLLRRLARLHLPGAHELIIWGRALFAAWILTRKWRSVEQLAHDLGWADDASLQDATLRCMNCNPTHLRGVASFAETKVAFSRMLMGRAG